MDEVKETTAKNKFISGLLGKKGDYNSMSEIVKKAKSYFDRPLRTLPAYDPENEGPLVHFTAPDGFKEIERYWLQEPYSFVSILEDRRTTYYRLVEPSLTKFEKELLERIYEDFQDILILGSTHSKSEKDAFLVDRAIFLLERYKADIS
ncbi:MAG TPA: secretion system protein E, partial [Methanosarcina sp.]|nr:secretion system protein E [Methanosarcina sp.]